MSSERRIGAIDAGSNALRAVVASATASGITVLDEQRAAVRLGSGTFTRGRIPTATVDEAIAAFARFRAMFDRHGVTDYRAVATSAVRDAENREVLLHRALHEAGVALQVIDGDEEARLVRKVTLHALARAHRDPTDDVACILDLGGGSLEVNLRRGPSWRGVSLPVGTVRLLETFGLYGALDASGAQIVRRYVATLVDGAVPAARRGLPVAARSRVATPTRWPPSAGSRRAMVARAVPCRVSSRWRTSRRGCPSCWPPTSRRAWSGTRSAAIAPR
jgi:exopolyphosphatase/guanosine-5'-triphosphate,3'-diphosphate pyrophosphatase